jgi:hypothetical protein
MSVSYGNYNIWHTVSISVNGNIDFSHPATSVDVDTRNTDTAVIFITDYTFPLGCATLSIQFDTISIFNLVQSTTVTNDLWVTLTLT